MPLSRLYTFAAGQLIASAKINDEYDQVIDALAGSLAVDIKLTYNNNDVPTLEVDNTGTGDLVDFNVLGVTKAKVNKDGVFESLLGSGDGAPFKCASGSDVCTNLDADLLDGLEGVDYLKTENPEAQSPDDTNPATLTVLQPGSTNDHSVILKVDGDQVDLIHEDAEHATTQQTIFSHTRTDTSQSTTFEGDATFSDGASFGGTVSGSDGVANDEFVTVGQLDTEISGGAGAIIVEGQSGGNNGKVVRLSSANTWANASQTDTLDQLEGLLFRNSNEFYSHGTVVTGLSGLSAGSVYYLSTSGNLTTTPPTPSATVSQVRIGVAIATTKLLFIPDRPIGG